MQALQVSNRRSKKGGKQRYYTHAKYIKVKALVLLTRVTDADTRQGTSQHGPLVYTLHSNQEDQLIDSRVGLPLRGT